MFSPDLHNSFPLYLACWELIRQFFVDICDFGSCLFHWTRQLARSCLRLLVCLKMVDTHPCQPRINEPMDQWIINWRGYL